MAENKKLQVPEEALKALGIDIEKLKEDPKTWEALEKGEKTKLLSLKGECAGRSIHFAAKIHLWEDNNGQVRPYIHSVYSKVPLGEYKNHEFSKKEMSMLVNKGQIDDPVMLKFGDKEYKCLVGVDPETREIVHVLCSNINLSDTILGVNVTKEQKEIIKNGGKILLEGLKDKDSMKKYDAIVSFSFAKNPGKGGISFRTPTAKELQELRVSSGKSEGKKEPVNKEQKKTLKSKVSTQQQKTVSPQKGHKL